MLLKTAPRTLPLLVLALASVLASPTASRAGGGPENVLLVVNPQSQESMAVANHYIDVRGIPGSNVFYLKWPTGTRATRGAVFLKSILKPIQTAIQERGLEKQIDCVVYSADFPFRVDFKQQIGPAPPRPGASPLVSITSATYLGQLAQEQPKSLLDPNTNRYFARRSLGVTISRAFNAQHRWSPDGRRVPSGGVRYMMSAMLGVTYNRASTVEQIKSYLSKSAQADGSNPEGSVYLMTSRDVRSRVRENQFQQAIKQIGLAGVRVQKLQGTFPTGKGDIIGVTCGTPSYSIRDARSKLRPGALGDNLTSFGGMFDRAPGPRAQTLLTEFLNNGGAGASGTVVEPSANPTKFPTAELHLHYARGCTMAESFYQSVLSPFQLIVVGDPLCQPYADPPGVEPEELADGDTVRGTVSVRPRLESERPDDVAAVLLYIDGKLTAAVKPGGTLEFDSTKLPDGPHTLSLTAIEKTPILAQSRWSGSVRVRNGTDAIQLSVQTAETPDGQELSVSIDSTVKDPIRLLHNGRELGRVSRGRGKLAVPAQQLGPGKSVVFAESVGSPGVRSKPVEVELP